MEALTVNAVVNPVRVEIKAKATLVAFPVLDLLPRYAMVVGQDAVAYAVAVTDDPVVNMTVD